MPNPLMDILSGLGNVLDTPGSVVRGLLTGDAGRAFEGILDPSKRVSGRDMLDKWGITNNDSGTIGDIGGFAAQVATDPLTWVGGTLAKTILGRGGKAVDAVDAAAVGGAKSASTLLDSAPGVGGYKKLADGTIERIAPLPAGDSLGVGANGVKTYAGGSKPLSEAEQWTGRRASYEGGLFPGAPTMTAEDFGVAPHQLNDLGAGKGLVRPSSDSLLGMRRQFTIAKDAGLDISGNPWAKFTGGMNPEAISSADRARQVFSGSREIVEEMANLAQSGGTMHGTYSPYHKLAVIAEGAPAGTARHESLHGLMDIARSTGETNRLSALPRMSANLQEMSSPTAQALGLLGEETAAHAAGSGRGMMNQARGGLDFLMKPNPYYGSQLASKSPLVAALYGTQAIPRAGAFGAGLGIGAGGAALLSQLGGQ